MKHPDNDPDQRVTSGPATNALRSYAEMRTAIAGGDYAGAQKLVEVCGRGLPTMTRDLIALEAALGVAQQCLALARQQRQEVAESMEEAQKLHHYAELLD